MPRSPKLRIGLALGSGVARGWAHIGVLRALDERGIVPDVVCATSIGALAAGFYLNGQLDVLEAWTRRLTMFKLVRYLNLRLGRSGLIAEHRLFAEMEDYLGDTAIGDLPVPFAAIATDLKTGHEVWLTDGRLVDVIRASFSLPAFMTPVRLDGRWLVDGALVNPVPVSACHAYGTDVVIAVNLSADGMTGTKGRLGLGAEAKADRLAVPRSGAADGHPAPSTLAVAATTLNIVQDRITRSRLAADPPDINIVPKVGHIGLLDFHRADELIAAGAAAVAQIEALLDGLVSRSTAEVS